MKIQHNAYHLTRQSPVTQRERLGSVPHDCYVQDHPFQPNTVPEPQPLAGKTLEFEGGTPVYADNPVFDKATGQLATSSQIQFVEEARYPIFGSGLSAAAGSVLGSVLAASLRGGPVSMMVAGVSALATFSGGALSAARDRVSVVDKEIPVFKTELVGYRHQTLNGVYAPDRPHSWPEGTGQLHYYLPQTLTTKVATVTTQEVDHRALSPQALAGLGFLGGLSSGLLS